MQFSVHVRWRPALCHFTGQTEHQLNKKKACETAAQLSLSSSVREISDMKQFKHPLLSKPHRSHWETRVELQRFWIRHNQPNFSLCSTGTRRNTSICSDQMSNAACAFSRDSRKKEYVFRGKAKSHKYHDSVQLKAVLFWSPIAKVQIWFYMTVQSILDTTFHAFA